jgi:hypothetical protein
LGDFSATGFNHVGGIVDLVSKFPKFVQLGKLDSVDEFAGEGVVDDRLSMANVVSSVVAIESPR